MNLLEAIELCKKYESAIRSVTWPEYDWGVRYIKFDKRDGRLEDLMLSEMGTKGSSIQLSEKEICGEWEILIGWEDKEPPRSCFAKPIWSKSWSAPSYIRKEVKAYDSYMVVEGPIRPTMNCRCCGGPGEVWNIIEVKESTSKISKDYPAYICKDCGLIETNSCHPLDFGELPSPGKLTGKAHLIRYNDNRRIHGLPLLPTLNWMGHIVTYDPDEILISAQKQNDKWVPQKWDKTTKAWINDSQYDSGYDVIEIEPWEGGNGVRTGSPDAWVLMKKARSNRGYEFI